MLLLAYCYYVPFVYLLARAPVPNLRPRGVTTQRCYEPGPATTTASGAAPEGATMSSAGPEKGGSRAGRGVAVAAAGGLGWESAGCTCPWRPAAARRSRRLLWPPPPPPPWSTTTTASQKPPSLPGSTRDCLSFSLLLSSRSSSAPTTYHGAGIALCLCSSVGIVAAGSAGHRRTRPSRRR